MEINKPMTTRNMLASTLTDYKKQERAVLARRGIMDHSDCEDCVEDWTFLMRQGRREFPLGLRTVLACLAFAEREGAVPELPADWWVNINRRYR